MSEDMLDLGQGILLPREQVQVEYARSSGPGGQHVNRTETKVILRLNVATCDMLPEAARERLLQRLAARLTRLGEILVRCDKHRSRRRNEEEAFERLQGVLAAALVRPRARKQTAPTRASKRRRLETKRRQSSRKQGRRPPGADD